MTPFTPYDLNRADGAAEHLYGDVDERCECLGDGCEYCAPDVCDDCGAYPCMCGWIADQRADR